MRPRPLRLVLAVPLALGLALPAGARSAPCAPLPVLDDRCEVWSQRATATDDTTIRHWVSPPTVSAGTDLVYATGLAKGGSLLTVAYDATTGAQRWRADDAGAHGWGPSPQVLSSDKGTLFVAGNEAGGLTVRAYDAATGETRWSVAWDQANLEDLPDSLALAPDGETIYVGGTTYRRGDRDLFALALDATTGAALWSHRFDGAAGLDELRGLMAVDPAGDRVYLAGSQNLSYCCIEPDRGDGVVLGLNSEDGSRLWTTSFAGPGGGRDQVAGIAADAEGVYVGATLDQDLEAADESADIAVLAFDPDDGAHDWTKAYDGPAGGPDRLSDLALDPVSGTLYATGWASVFFDGTDDTAAWFSDDSDVVTIALDAGSGAVRWTNLIGLPGHRTEGGAAVAVAPGGGRVYVSGPAEAAGFGFFGPNSGSLFADSGLGSYLTAALSATDGTAVWTARFRGEPDEGARAWAVSVAPDGSRVYVAGRVAESTPDPDTFQTASDYVTVAYPA